MDTLQLAREIAEEAHDTKAQDLRVLDLQKLVSYTDYFVLATGTSDRHVQAIADRIYRRLKDKFRRFPLSYEGMDSGQWVLLDYGDVVFHVFQPDQRGFYGLDDLWADAPEIFFFGEPKKAAKPKKPSKAPVKKRPSVKGKAKSRPKRPAAKKKTKKKR